MSDTSKTRLKLISDYCEINGREKTCKQFNISEETLSRYLRLMKNEKTISNKCEFNQVNDLASLSGQAKSLEDLLKKANVNLDLWEVESYEIKDNSWDVTMADRDQDLVFEKDPDGKQVMTGYAKRNGQITKTNKQYHIKAKLIKRKDFTEKSMKNFIKDIPEFKFTHFKPQNTKKSGIALEMATLDAHFGKLAWIGETAYRNYDTEKSMQDYDYAVDKNLNWSSHEKIEKIFFIVGQDLFHVDNLKNHTTHGEHTMDVDGRMPKIYEKAFKIILNSIYKCRSVAPVEIIWSPGNHDYLASMFLCYALNEHFRNDKHVTVDITKEDGKITRKARLWGNLLVGWTHRIVGKENTWGNELAQQFPELWGQSKFREWHCGDQHKKKTTKTMTEFTSGGVLIRQLTALSPVDRWHFENVFTDAVPGGEAFLWSKDHGVFANYIAWTGQYEENRNKLIKNK
jgi:hypothetical protein